MRVQATEYNFLNNFDYSASALNALTFAFQQELHNIKRNDKIHGRFKKFYLFLYFIKEQIRNIGIN